ncbi:fatty acid-binding protein, heart-like [Choristoneura fumiferana]|uniref:fatty acid-binding protein, heart-like n=1 Tax=Choristoneura fumiferana TaxID=7141 RepID=UPI003D156F38
MSFYGKKFKKAKFDKVLELMDAMAVTEKTRNILKQFESLTSFKDNGDGTIQYLVTLGDKEIINQTITLGVEKDFKTPEDIVTKVTFTFDGGKLKSVMKFPDGKVLYMDREFDDNTMTLYIWLEGVDIKASVTYEAV